MGEVVRLFDHNDIKSRLERDRVWSAFSLADLDDVRASHSTWFGVAESTSVVLIYNAYEPPIVFCSGAEAECEAIIHSPDVVGCTSQVYINVRPEAIGIAQRAFSTLELRPMIRMQLEASVEAERRFALVSLGPEDLAEVQRLYAEERPAFFLPSQLEDGVYYGIRDEAGLISIAGTHVVSEEQSVAALGNVYTTPRCRNRGLAAATAGAVSRELQRRGIRTIVLNILDSNLAARRVYERLGYREYCAYFEGLGVR